MLRLSQEFNATIDLGELLPRILDLVRVTLDAEAGSLWLLEEDGIRCRVAQGPGADLLAQIELPVGAGIVGDVIAEARPVRLEDPRSDPRYLPQVDALTGLETRSVVTVPLLARGSVLGALQIVNRRDGGAFDRTDQQFLEALADDAAAALRNARLFEAEKRARDLRALLDFTHEITASLDLDRVLLSIVNLAGRAIPFRRSVLAVFEREVLVVKAISGETEVDRTSPSIKAIESFLRWTDTLDEEFYVRDTGSNDDESAAVLRERFPEYLAGASAGCIKIERIRDGQGPLGVLLFEFDRPGSLDEWSLEAADLLAHESALALRNAQLYADVPFIGLLETVADRRRRLRTLPTAIWLRWGMVSVAALLVLTFVRVPLRVAAVESSIRSVVQRPARAAWSGIVERIDVAEGDRVVSGQSLAMLRNEVLALDISRARADLELAGQESVSAAAAGDGAATTRARAREEEAAEVLAVLSELDSRQRILAPSDGLILSPRMHERVGTRLESGEILAWVGDPAWVELEMDVRQRDLGRVRIDDPVRARVDARPDLTFEGRVVALAPVVRPGERGPVGRVHAILDNRDGQLRPGMVARARIHTRPRPLGVFLFQGPWRWFRMRIWW